MMPYGWMKVKQSFPSEVGLITEAELAGPTGGEKLMLAGVSPELA